MVFEPEPETVQGVTTPLSARKFWQEIKSLVDLPEGTVLPIQNVYKLQKYKKDYLVLVANDTHYFAGESLEGVEIPADARIRLGKAKNGKTGAKIRYRECVLIQKEEWWKLVDHRHLYGKHKPREEDILDTKRVGEKTVLALLQNGEIVLLSKTSRFFVLGDPKETKVVENNLLALSKKFASEEREEKRRRQRERREACKRDTEVEVQKPIDKTTEVESKATEVEIDKTTEVESKTTEANEVDRNTTKVDVRNRKPTEVEVEII